MLLLIALFVAQILDPHAPVQAYTSADPINPDRFGLATPDGRYSITPIQECDWLAVEQNVNVYPNWQMPPWLGLSGTDSMQPGCVVRVEGRMSNVPCFTNADGLCDVAAESDEAP
jgi:hypothetical protein